MKIDEVLKKVRPTILGLEPYSTARDDCGSNQPEIFLDANENPYNNGINRYPDPHQKALKAKIAEIKALDIERLFLGNGSDEAIDLVYRVFCVPGESNAVSIAPSYGMYEVAAAMNDVEFRKVQLKSDFSMDTDAMLSASDSKTRLMFICSPNNPTGNSFPVEQIEDILERFSGMVVLDEAYIDFSVRPSLVSLIDRHPNLIVLQTLSKAWGMAGLRIGLAIADPAVISLMSKVKYPYNINVLAQKMALAKLDADAKEKAVAEIVGQRFRLEKELVKCPEVKGIYSSDANFLLVRFDAPDEVYERLLAGGVIVRNRSKVPGCEGCLRITVGTPVENDRLLRLLGTSCHFDKLSDRRGLLSDRRGLLSDRRGSVAESPSPVAEPLFPVAEPVEAHRTGIEILGERHVRITRNTKETRIVLELNLDPYDRSLSLPKRTDLSRHFDKTQCPSAELVEVNRSADISTGLPFFDHMLEQIPNHGGVSLSINAKGDLQVDEHHTIEDVGIVLGEAINAALGRKLGIARYGFVLPMDDCDAAVLMDFGGRIDFKWNVEFKREKVGDVPTEMFSHFFQSLCSGAKCNLHIWAEGENEHHKAEAIFKAFARALRMAVARTPFPYELPSSKGVL